MNLLKEFRLHFHFDENRVSVDAHDDWEDSAEHQDLFLDAKYHPYLDVQFGAEKAHAVWDTGAGITVVDTNFITAHPAFFQEVGQSIGTDSSGSQAKTPMFVMSSAVIADRMFPPLRVAGVDLSFVNSTLAVPMDLILGYNALSKANWLFDFPRKKWAITRWLGG
jgi:hypothetical protein